MTALSNQLKEHGLKVSRLQKGVTMIDCPKSFCKKEREASGNNEHKYPLALEIIDDHSARWKCTFCLWSDHITPPKEPTHEAPPATWQDFLTARGVSPESILSSNAKWDDSRQAIAIPNKQAGGKVIAVTYYRLDGTSWYEAKTPSLYGIAKVAVGYPVVIAQDEIDALLLRGLGIENVVGIPNGGLLRRDGEESTDLDFIAGAADILLQAERIIVATSNTPLGSRLRAEVIRRLGPAKCWNSAFIRPTLQQELADHGPDAVCAGIHEATACPIMGLYEVQDFERELMQYFDSGMAAGESTGWENVDRYYTVAPAQLTLVTGIPNTGKSEWLDALTMNLVNGAGWKVAVWSPENGKAPHATKLIEKRVMMPADPGAPMRMNRETYLEGAAWVNQWYFFIDSDSRTQPATIEWVLERATDAVLRHGVRGLIIDPFNRLRKSKDAPENVDQYVSYVLDLVLNFLHQHSVHVWLVAHPKTLIADQKTKKYSVPGPYDISGGANFFNMADNIIVVHRSEDIAEATEVHVKKIRFKHIGKRTQIPPLLVYDIATGKYSEPEEGTARFSVAEKEIESIDAY